MDEHSGFRPPDESDEEDEASRDEPSPRSLFADVPELDPDEGPIFSFSNDSSEEEPGFGFPDEPDDASDELEGTESDLDEESTGTVFSFPTADADGEPTGVLPHWTEPPTETLETVEGPGAPQDPGVAFRRDDLFEAPVEDDPADAWASLEEPAWRDTSDWHESSAPAATARLGGESPPSVTSGAGDTEPERSQPSTGADGGTGRNLPLAAATGVGLVVVYLALANISPGAVMALVTPLLVVATAEVLGAVRRVGYQPATLMALSAVVGLALGSFWVGEAAIPIVLGLTVMFSFAWYLAEPVARPMANLGVGLLSILWVGLLGSFAALLLKLPEGTEILTVAIAGTIAYDLGGYVIGRTAGQSVLAPNVSPNKTWEGLIGGMLLTIATVVVISLLELGGPFDSLARGLTLGIAIAVAAPIGDLSESIIKRDLGIKDVGSILPGHGGVLDRFDALLFVLPATYYVARILDIA